MKKLLIYLGIVCCLMSVVTAQNHGEQKDRLRLVFEDNSDTTTACHKRINKYISIVEQKGRLTPGEAMMLIRTIERLRGDVVYGKMPNEREEMVRSLLGERGYKTFQEYCYEVLEAETSPPSSKITAMSVLGRGLMHYSSKEKLRGYVFSENEGLQYKAILNLIYLGEKGMEKLLRDIVLAGKLSPPSKLSALEALEAVNSSELKSSALWIVFHEQEDPYLVRKALESIEGKESHVKAVEAMFLSSKFAPSSDHPLKDSGKNRNMLNFYLLETLFKNWSNITEKGRVLAKAKSLLENRHPDVYLYSGMLIAQYATFDDKEEIKKILQKTMDNPQKKKFLERLLKENKSTE